MRTDAPHLAEDHAFANLYAVHYDCPDIDYYGPGAELEKDRPQRFPA